MQPQRRNGKPVDETLRPLSEVCREHIARLYRLAYLITGDGEQSIQAVGAALNFYEADLDVRELVVAEALKRISTQLTQSILLFDDSLGSGLEGGIGARSTKALDVEAITPSDVERALLAIDVFPRCVVLLTALERFSDKEASKVLGVNEGLVKLARAQGLIELTRNMRATPVERRDVFSQVFPSKKFCRASVN